MNGLIKMKKIVSLIVFSLAMCGFTIAQSLAELDKAKEIKLLEFNRNDVAKIFAGYEASVTNKPNDYEWFSTKDATVRVSYSSGKCSDNFEDWNIPEGKAKEIEFSLTTAITLKDSGIDLTKYKKEKEYVNLARAYIYHNKDLGIAFEVYKNKIFKIYLIPSKEKYPLLCDTERVQTYYRSESWFNVGLKERIYIQEYRNLPPDVINLNLSLTEITATCGTERSACLNKVRSIFVSTLGKDPENDVLIYDYKISGGKIIGQGANVVWDLSDAKPGTYTITAAVDDGCGLCGKSITKTVIVKECPNCSAK